MVNDFDIVVLLYMFECMREKERVLGEEERKMNLRGRESVETNHKCKNWPNISLFIARILSTYYLLYFSLFYYLYKGILFYSLSNE